MYLAARSAERSSCLGGVRVRKRSCIGKNVRMHDGEPLLITTTSSEEDARARLPEECRSEDVLSRFRTNIHVDTSNEVEFAPYAEDGWEKLVVYTHAEGLEEQVELDVVFRTPRCQSLNVDFLTGGLMKTDEQLYKLLVKDRRVNPKFPMKLCFGMYAFAAPSGSVLRVGDVVEVVEEQV